MTARFTDEAKWIWAQIPPQKQQMLLANVWCSHCSSVATLVEFSGEVRGGNLVLEGSCHRCRGNVARLIEAE